MVPRQEGKGLGTLYTWRQFTVLQAQQSMTGDYLQTFVLEHMRSRDGAQDQGMSPEGGLGTRLIKA